jgi:hypothetical protein
MPFRWFLIFCQDLSKEPVTEAKTDPAPQNYGGTVPKSLNTAATVARMVQTDPPP